MTRVRASNAATRGLVSKQLNRRPTAVVDGGGLSFLIGTEHSCQ